MVKNLPANLEDTGDAGSIPRLGRYPGGENGNPLKYSCLENLIDRGAWWAGSTWGCKEIFIGKTCAEIETSILWLLMKRANSLEETLMLGNIEGKRRRGRQRMKWSDSITDSMDTNLSKLWETVEDR